MHDDMMHVRVRNAKRSETLLIYVHVTMVKSPKIVCNCALVNLVRCTKHCAQTCMLTM